MTSPTISFELDELLEGDVEVPCEHCSKVAVWRSFGHNQCWGGHPHKPPFHKCDRCYNEWSRRVRSKLERMGSVMCTTCCQGFSDISLFSSYHRL